MRSETGLDLDLYKPDQIRRRIIRMAVESKSGSLDEFWETLALKPDGISWLTDMLAINVSRMFRDPNMWEQLKDRILPGLLSDRPNLKCWSAGCSFGAEAHTLAVVLDVHFKGQHDILGTDIDRAALGQASEGLLRDIEMGDTPFVVRNAYYTLDTSSMVWRARLRLAERLRFVEHDLLSESFESDFDLITCRNVLIYLTDAAREQLFRRFLEALRPGGVLFLGNTERILNPGQFGFEEPLPHFYRKLAA